jgi:hypothetical protein
MTDNFAQSRQELHSPLGAGAAVTPDDNNDNIGTNDVSREIFFATAGTVRVTWASGLVGNFAVLAGDLRAWRVRRIHATGTTATGIEAFW